MRQPMHDETQQHVKLYFNLILIVY